MKIWRDSLNAYSAKKKDSRSSAKHAISARRRKNAKAEPSPGEWIAEGTQAGSLGPGEQLAEEKLNAMLGKIFMFEIDKDGNWTSAPDADKLTISGDIEVTSTLNKTKDITMKLDKSERYLIPSIQGPRPISLYSLRPGDWLYAEPATGRKGYDLMVVQNSNVLKRIELLWPSGRMEVAPYEHLVLTGEGVHYLGHGNKRLWLNKLPRFVRRFFNTHSKP